MTWNAIDSQGLESRKCRHRVLSLMAGRGLDLGCGSEKVCETAIGIDRMPSPAVDMQLDLTEQDALRIFANDAFDYVFSSHCLEDMEDTCGALKEWWRVIRYGGHLILYGPDPEYYPRIGTEGCNPAHRHDLAWEEVWNIIKSFGNAKLVSATRHNDSNEYSWQIVARKELSIVRRPIEVLNKKITSWCHVLPRVRKASRECLIIRYGALGDAIWMTPVLRQLKKDGWYIVYNTTEYSAQVLRDCPYIDEFLIQPQNGVANDQLNEYWDALGREFDRVINFSGSVEGKLLLREGSEEFDWPHAKRHHECNVNYQDATMAVAGYPQMKGERPELHFSESEEVMAASLFRTQLKDVFVILWSMAGSSFHKHYPWTPYVTGELYKRYPKDVRVVTVGDHDCQIIEPHGPNVVRKAGVLPVRSSMLLTKYVNLVVGPETGILNAASCFPTPKIVFMSHSTEENLTKYWENVTPLHAGSCPCAGCHRLIYSNSCPKGPLDLAPLCMENLQAITVFNAISKWVERWRRHEPPYGPSQPTPQVKVPRSMRRAADKPLIGVRR